MMDILGFPSTAITDSTSVGRSLVTAASAAAAATAAGVGAGDSPQFTAIELGHASDTTLSRSSAGVLAVEGVTVALNSTTRTHTAQQIELGHASDTTITRVSAGVAAIEGATIRTGTVAETVGGTNQTSYATGDLLYASATNTLSKLAGAVTVLPQWLRSIGNGSSNTGTSMAFVPGQVLAASYVTTNETTTSTTAVDLATTQHLTFSLPSSTDVLIRVSIGQSSNSAVANNTIYVDIDGTDSVVGIATEPVATYNFAMTGVHHATLSSGSHTIKLQFSASVGTASFAYRSITVQVR